MRIRRSFLPMVMSTALVFSATMSQAARHYDGTVVFTGWLQAFDQDMSDVIVEVTLNGMDKLVAVSESGRFKVELPQGTQALLRFKKPGHVTKEILLDTNDATAPHVRRPHVKFAVILELVRHMARWTYAGPVGSIVFQNGSAVAMHTRELMPEDTRFEF